MKAILASLVISMFTLSASADYFCSMDESVTLTGGSAISTMILLDDGSEYTGATLLGSDTGYSLEDFASSEEGIQINDFLEVSIESDAKDISSDAENGRSYFYFNQGDSRLVLTLKKSTFEVAGETLSEVTGSIVKVADDYDGTMTVSIEATTVECKEINLTAKK